MNHARVVGRMRRPPTNTRSNHSTLNTRCTYFGRPLPFFGGEGVAASLEDEDSVEDVDEGESGSTRFLLDFLLDDDFFLERLHYIDGEHQRQAGRRETQANGNTHEILVVVQTSRSTRC